MRTAARCGAVSPPQVVKFLEHVASEIVVVLDRAMIHRAKAVQAFAQLHKLLSLGRVFMVCH